MSRSLGVLTLDLIAKTGGFEQGMDRASRRVRQTANEMEAAKRAADRLVAGIAAAAAGFATAATAMAVSSARSIDATAKMAQQIGTTTESLTGMRFAAQQFANISDQQFDMSMRRMTRRIAEAAAGGGSAKSALEAMGLSARELARLAPEQQMLAIADAMQRTEKQADRLRYTMALFDTEGMALVPALQQGAEAFEANIALARQFGVVVSQEAAAAAEQFMTNMNLLNEAQKGFKNQVAEVVLPILARFTGNLVEIAESAGDMRERVETALKVVGVAAAATATILTSRLLGSIGKTAWEWSLATRAAAVHQAQLAATAAAATGASRTMSASAAAMAASMTTFTRVGRVALGVMGGPAGIIATSALAGAAFLAMGRDAKSASVDIDDLAESFKTLSQQKLELRLFDLEDEVRRLEDQARESGQILRTMEADARALANAQGVTADELENVRRSLLEQRDAHNENLTALDRARTLYVQVFDHLQNLRGAAHGAAGGVRDLNEAMHSEAGEKYLAQLQGQIKALQDGGDPIKTATRWISEHADATDADKTAIMSAAHALKALQDAQKAATASTKAGSQALNEAKRAAEAFARERRQYLNGLYNEVSGLQAQARGLEQQIALYGLAESAKYDLAIADLEREKAAIAIMDREAEEIAIIERKIELLNQMKGSQQTLERLEAEKAAWEEWSRDVEQIFNRVGQSLTDAIFDGGKSGKELLKDLFKGLTFNILINPVMGAMQNWVTQNLGGMFGVQQPQGSGMLGLAQNANTLYQAYSGGMASNLGQGIQWIGNKIGSQALQSFATGLTGAAGAAGTVAGITSVGAGLGASLGASIGTSTAAMASTSFSAALSGGAGASMAATAGASGFAGAGAALGAALPWVGGALAIGSLLGGGLFDREPTTRREQRTQVEYAGGIFDVTKTDDRAPAGADQAARALAEQAVQTANDIFKQVGIDAAVESFHAIMASSYKGDRDGVASGGTLRIGDELRQIGIGLNDPNPTIQGFGGWSSAETLPRLAIDVSMSLMEALQAAGVMAHRLDGLDIRGMAEDQVTALATTIQQVVQEVTAFSTVVEHLPFANLKDLSFEARDGLLMLTGGLEDFVAGQQSWIQNYMTEAERTQMVWDEIGRVLGEVNLAVPDSRDGLRDLRESLDLTTEQGREAFAAIMSVESAFASVTPSADELAEAARRAKEAIDSQREGLERQLLSAMGDTAAIRALELAALDESNRALQEHIWAIQDKAEADARAAEVLRGIELERAGIERQILQITGDTAAIRALELEALDESNRALQERAWLLQSEADIQRERYGLETQLLQLLGDTDTLRARQLDTLDASNHAIQREIWALQDKAAAEQEATRAAQDHANAIRSLYSALESAGRDEISRLEQSFGVTDAAMDAYRSRVQQLQSDLQSVIDTMRTSVRALRGEVDSTSQMQYTQARAVISTSVVTGRLPQTANLSEAIQAAQQGVMDGVYATRFDRDKAYLTLANEIEAVQDIAKPQLSTAEATLARLEEQYDLLRGTHRVTSDSLEVLEYQLRTALSTEEAAREQIDIINQQLDYAKGQYDRLGGVQNSIEGGFSALLSQFSSLTGVSVPAFASGGFHAGGLRLVGERGPELEITGPSRIYNASQTQDILRQVMSGNTQSSNRELIEENRLLRRQVEKMTAYLYQITKETKRTAQHTEPLERSSDDVVVVY